MNEAPEVLRSERGSWNPATRIAFRFLFVYFLLFFLPDPFSFSGFLVETYFDATDALVVLMDENLVHLPYEIRFEERQVGSSPYGWLLFLGFLALAAAVTAAWSVLDRKRLRYARLHAWFRLAMRWMLARIMIGYGAIKVIPWQMTAPPPLGAVQQRIGDMFPNHLLWWTVGASPPFETATGLAELLGGVLLLLPRTTLLGALITAANMLFVFLLNLCYDVPVKLPSLHFLVMAVILIAPDLRRLASVFLWNRRVEPARPAPLFERRWLDRIPHVLLLLFGLYTIGSAFQSSAERYRMFHPPRPPLYGLWSVEGFARDGRDVPLYTEPDRWRLVRFERPGSVQVEQMAGAFKVYELGLDMERKLMTLGPSAGTFAIARPEKDVLVLDGQLEGRRVRAKLRKMPLLRRTT